MNISQLISKGIPLFAKNPTAILALGITIIYIILTYLNPVHLNHQNKIQEGFSDALNFYFFYSPSCPHSKRFLENQWPILKKKYQSQIVFNQFNCQDQDTKGICQRFGIREVPALFLIQGSIQLEFKGDRSLPRLEKFLQKNIKDHQEHFQETKPTPEIIVSDTLPAQESAPEIKKVQGIVPCQAELTKFEDLDDEIYEYSIQYPKEYSQYNMTLKTNLKKEPGVRPYQLAYTIIHEHLRRCGNNDLEKMKKIAYQMKDKIAEWGLAQRELLEQIRKQSEDQKEKDVTTAIMYGMGFI